MIFSEGRLQAVKIDHGESLRISHTPVLFNNLSIEFCTHQRGLKLGVHNIIQQNKLDGLIPFSARKFMESIRNILMKINPHNFDAKINYNTCHLSPDLISTIENSISTFLTSHPDMSIMKIAKIPSIENINKKETQYIILSKKRSDYLAALKGISNSILQKTVTESLFTIDFFIKLNIQLGMDEKIIELLRSIKSKLDSLQNKSLSMESRSILQQEASFLLDSYQKEMDIFINDDSLALKPHSLDATDYFNKLLSQNTGSLLRMYRFLDLIFNKLNYKEDLYLDDIKSILQGKECGLLKFVISNLEEKLFFNEDLSPVTLIDLFLQKPELILEIKKLSVKFDIFDQDFLEKLITKNYFSRLIISLFDFLVSQEKMAPAICDEKEFYKLQRFFRIQNPSFMSLIFLVLSNHYADYPSSDMDENRSFNYFVKIFNNEADDHFRIIDDIEANSVELNLFSTLILKSNDNQENNIIGQKIDELFKHGAFNQKLDLIIGVILNDPIKLQIYSKKEDRSLPLLQAPHGFESQYLTIYLNILSNCPISSLSLMNELLGHILDSNIESVLNEYILSDITDSFYLSLVYWALKIDFDSLISNYALSEDFKILKAIIIGLTLIEETKTPQEIYEILKTKCPHLIYQNNISKEINLPFNIEPLSPEHQLIINQVCSELIQKPEDDVTHEDSDIDFNFNSQEKSTIDADDTKAGTAKSYFAAFEIAGNHKEILRASAKDKKLLLSTPSASRDSLINQSSEIDFLRFDY